MKKQLITIFSALLIATGAGLSAVHADDAPDVRTKFDVNHMSQYSDDQLSTPATLTNFYVKAVHKDKMDQYHYLLVPSKGSNQYFLLVSDSKIKKAKVGHKVTIDGTLNGKGVVNMGYKSSPYQHKPAVLFMND